MSFNRNGVGCDCCRQSQFATSLFNSRRFSKVKYDFRTYRTISVLDFWSCFPLIIIILKNAAGTCFNSECTLGGEVLNGSCRSPHTQVRARTHRLTIHTRIHTHAHTLTHTYTHTQTDKHKHTHTHTHTHADTHTLRHIPPSYLYTRHTPALRVVKVNGRTKLATFKGLCNFCAACAKQSKVHVRSVVENKQGAETASSCSGSRQVCQRAEKRNIRKKRPFSPRARGGRCRPPADTWTEVVDTVLIRLSAVS